MYSLLHGDSSQSTGSYKLQVGIAFIGGFCLALVSVRTMSSPSLAAESIDLYGTPAALQKATSNVFMQPMKARQPMQPLFAEPQANEAKRRDLLAGASFALAGTSAAKQAHAAYGDGANVFGGITNPSAFSPYAGDGFSLLLPSKWNPSKEREFPGIAVRYEDNFDAVNNLMVIKEKTDKSKVEDLGNPEKFLQDHTYLLGTQSYSGQTISEGGFAPNRVSAASVLDVATDTDKKGRSVYKYNILCRTADGDEGGRHQLISATVSSGTLYILRIQVGDKRWFKGTKKEAEGAFNSFSPA